MNILELPAAVHPYFGATQAHPELSSRPLSPQPFFLGLVHAAMRRAYADYDEPLVFASARPAEAQTNTEPVA